MRLFRRLAVLCSLALFFSTCEDDRLKLPRPSAPTPPPVTNPATPTPDLSVQIFVFPASFNFTQAALSGQLSVTILSKVYVSWTITHKPDWLTATPHTGGNNGGLVTLQASTTNLFLGKQIDKLTFVASSATTSVTVEVPVSVDVTVSKAVTILPAPLFNSSENSKVVTIKNSGNSAASWQLESSAPWLSVTPNSGLLAPSQTADLTLTINRSTLEPKNYIEHLDVKVGGVKNSEVPVGINNLVLLTDLVVDAEYDRAGDKLYVVTKGNKLLKLSSTGETLATLSLPNLPTSISVAQNGQKAVVGHEASISVIDLAAMSVSVTYPVSCYALDVVLAPNNWAYVFPGADQWTTLRCIDLQTGTEVQHSGGPLYAGTRGRLHPSGDYIYGANNGVSPSDAEKYDIRTGQAVRLYDSPYHGEYSFAGDLWMADNGARMFSRGKASFTLTTSQSTDMQFVGSIPSLSQRIKTMDHITTTNRICAIYFNDALSSTQNSVHIYSADVLNFIESKRLPDFISSTSDNHQFVGSEGHYGFFNSAGNKFIVLFRSPTITGFAEQWAITSVSVN